MTTNTLSFRYPWRAYQSRVLGHLDQYRQDRRIHIVAPPGAGKTVLGLEVVRRIGKQTLILAPSLTIKQQWAQRLIDDFGADKQLISHRLDRPRDFTIVTYQAVYQFYKRAKENEIEPQLPWLEVLVVDECHHLRNEWWRALKAIYEQHKPELIALTATPPYDVSSAEWKRYHSFCGEIDEEISIPELVAAGDLCPHQDYIYPILPRGEAAESLQQWLVDKRELDELFRRRSELAYFIQEHPWLAKPESYYTEIFEEPEYFTALLSVLAAQGSPAPPTCMGILHGEATIAPDLDDDWATIFLQKALRDDPYFESQTGKELMKPFKRQLTKLGAWRAGKLSLDPVTDPRKSALTESVKLEAIAEIVKFESDQLGEDLRLVVLTDFVLDELLPTTEHDRTALSKVGAATVFEQLRRSLDSFDQAGLSVLTGSLIVIPKAVEPELLDIAYSDLPTERVIKTRPLFENSNYVLVDKGTLDNKYSVRWITELFSRGHLRIIVGTKALLGEGWDAPHINSLILANRVGSFVSSNQMRGRAIRTLRDDPNKTANIWHPVTVFPGIRHGGDEVKKLKRRFKAFAGPEVSQSGEDPLRISNGLSRTGFDVKEKAPAQILDTRNSLLSKASQRSQLNDIWSSALASGTQLVEVIKPPSERYYKQSDKLVRHYRESSHRQAEWELRKLALGFRLALVLAFGVACFSLFLQENNIRWLFSPLSLLLIPALKRYQKLFDEIVQSLESASDYFVWRSELKPNNFIIATVILAFLLSPWITVGPVNFLSTLGFAFFCVSLIVGKSRRQKLNHRVKVYSNPRKRLEIYGKSLGAALEEVGAFQNAKAENVSLEEDFENQEVQCFLENSVQHDSHLFASALNELFMPAENPRWLLQLKPPADWNLSMFYIPVPKPLGTKKGANLLAEELSSRMEQEFTTIYTRNPSGRQHLISARLLDIGRHADSSAKRAMLWH
ncbi:MAG: DEAD/DEAH box helicase family protein [Bacteroidota bacterium]